VTRAPTFSVLLPFFNERSHLRAAIMSVQAQTYPNWEIVAVDDGSTDGSGEIVTRAASDDPRVRLVRRKNGGLPAARNTGIGAARGRYCALLDADDIWLPEKLERQLPLVKKRTVAFSEAWAEEDGVRYPYSMRLSRARGDYPVADVFNELLRQNFIPSLTAVLPIELLRGVGAFDERLSLSLDWDLWLRLALGGARFDYVAEPLAVYRVRSGSLSSDHEAVRRESVIVLRLLSARVDAPRREAVAHRLDLARRELEVFLRKRAWMSAAEGDNRSARRDLIAAAQANPRSVRAILGLALMLLPPLLGWYARRRPPATFVGEFVRH
jgi:glycosyltransferase involved in cell wall biosynthesis